MPRKRNEIDSSCYFDFKLNAVFGGITIGFNVLLSGQLLCNVDGTYSFNYYASDIYGDTSIDLAITKEEYDRVLVFIHEFFIEKDNMITLKDKK